MLKNLQQEYTKRLISAVLVPDPAEQRMRREARRAGKLAAKNSKQNP